MATTTEQPKFSEENIYNVRTARQALQNIIEGIDYLDKLSSEWATYHEKCSHPSQIVNKFNDTLITFDDMEILQSMTLWRSMLTDAQKALQAFGTWTELFSDED